MKLAFPLCVTLAAVSACAVAPPPPPRPALSSLHTQALAVVETNSDAARIVAGLRHRGVALVPSDISRVDLLAGSPGFAWRVGADDWLHIHSYSDRGAAAAAAQRFVTTATSRSQLIDWVGKPHLFHCGTAVALHLGEAPAPLNVLASMCGPPVWRQ